MEYHEIDGVRFYKLDEKPKPKDTEVGAFLFILAFAAVMTLIWILNIPA